MIDMIRVGRTRNLLRASSSLSEIWPRSAHHHLGQRHLTGRTKRPDKSPHSITMPKPRKFLANESGIHKRRLDGSPVRSATRLAEQFLRRRREFPLPPQVIAADLVTASAAARLERAFSGPIFSGPRDLVVSVTSLLARWGSGISRPNWLVTFCTVSCSPRGTGF